MYVANSHFHLWKLNAQWHLKLAYFYVVSTIEHTVEFYKKKITLVKLWNVLTHRRQSNNWNVWLFTYLIKEIANLTCFVVSISCSLVLPVSDDMRNSSNLCYPMPFIRKRVNWINLQHFYPLGYGENYHQFIFTFPHQHFFHLPLKICLIQ